MLLTEIARTYYNAFNNKAWSRMAGLVHPDVLHFPNNNSLRTGRSAFLEYVQSNARRYDEWLTSFTYFANEAERKIAIEYVVNGKYIGNAPGFPPAHGQSYVLPGGAFFDVKDKLIYRISTYYNSHDWLDQVSSGGQRLSA